MLRLSGAGAWRRRHEAGGEGDQPELASSHSLPPPLSLLLPFRLSPYFFNAGLLHSGALLSTTAHSYASSLLSSEIGTNFDVLFGPAYKGIPLAAVTCMALSERHNVQKDFCYNRKEKKDHGEGGSMVGAELKGRVVIIDDVLTRGVSSAVHLSRFRPPSPVDCKHLLILLRCCSFRRTGRHP